MSEVKLYCGDCLEVMKQIEAGSVDAVVTDPPYGVNLKHNSAFDDTSTYWLNVVPPVIAYGLGQEATTVVFGAAPMIYRDAPSFERLPERTLIWSPKFSLSGSRSNGMFYRWHPVYCWNLATRHAGPSLDVMTESTDGHCWWYHPGTKPLALMERLIQLVPEGATVLDPFMGSGTTGVACVNTGRNFIGIEISEEYYNVACKRIADAQAQLTLEEVA